MDYVIDVETTARGGTKAPFKDPGWAYTSNELLVLGEMLFTHTGIFSQMSQLRFPISSLTATSLIEQADVVVGHNLAFDLGWLMRAVPSTRSVLEKDSVFLWDTMVVEAMLWHQNPYKFTSLSLNTCLENHGIDAAKHEFDVSNLHEDMANSKELLDYNKQDLLVTHKLYQKQMEVVSSLGIEQLVINELRALKETILMSQNGIYFDVKGANTEMARLSDDISNLEKTLNDFMYKDYPAGARSTGVSSNDILGRFLHGGVEKYVEKVPLLDEDGNPVLFKSGINKGNVRYTKAEKSFIVPDKLPTGYVGGYTEKGAPCVDTKALTALLDAYTGTIVWPDMRNFIAGVLKLREWRKDYSTYYASMIGYSSTSFDDRIHPEYNHHIVATGRLSSSAPNLQNITSADE